MIERKGSFTSLAHGGQFWPLDPRPDEIRLADIARALSMQCRWGGHVREFISVAQHCVIVSRHCRGYDELGLLHDSAEAYLVDVPTPIKKHLEVYYEIEQRLLGAIGERFGFGRALESLPPEVHVADARALATEHRDFRTSTAAFWTPPAKPFRERLTSWSPKKAERAFLKRAKELWIR